jgi:uncharacterized protein
VKRPAPRVVLDTNVLLSALLWSHGPVGRLRVAWQSGRIVPLASTATAQELVRVLAYPKFQLSASEREELLADWLPWVEVVRMPDPLPQVAACRDPFDLPFLQLALLGRAQALVSGDRDLLDMAATRGLCPIMTVDAFCNRWLIA